MSEQKSNNMVNIGGLWVNKTKDGDVYLSGYLNGARLLIFKNKFKDSDNKPDYIMNVVSPDKKTDPPANDLEASLNGDSAPLAPEKPKDDIPF